MTENDTNNTDNKIGSVENSSRGERKVTIVAMMESKLARRMAYKKKLEEEYRMFQERCKVNSKYLFILNANSISIFFYQV